MKKTITVRQATELFGFLSSLDKQRDDAGNVVAVNKNRINDRHVRAAVIDNIIATLPVKETFARKYKELQNQYFSDSYKELLKQRVRAEQTNDSAALADINKAITEEEAIFADEYNASFTKIQNEEVEVDLVEIDRNDFDAATEVCDFSLRVYADFAFMFKTDKTGGENGKN